MRPSGVVTSPSAPRILRNSSRTAGLRGIEIDLPADYLSFRAPASPAPSSGGGREERAVKRATTVGRGTKSPSESIYLPGVAGHEELGDVAGSTIRDRTTLLFQQDFLIDRRRARRQHTDRERELRRPQVGEQLRSVHVRLVVDPQRTVGQALGTHDLGHHTFHDDRLPIVRRAEQERLTVLELELVLELGLFLVHDVPREVVVYVAVLQDLEEAGPLVVGGALEHLLHVADVAIDGAADERRATAQREGERIDRAVSRAHRRGLRHLPLLARR